MQCLVVSFRRVFFCSTSNRWLFTALLFFIRLYTSKSILIASFLNLRLVFSLLTRKSNIFCEPYLSTGTLLLMLKQFVQYYYIINLKIQFYNQLQISKKMRKYSSLKPSIANDMDDYQIVQKIGSGMTADVYEAKSKKYGRVSIKAVHSTFYSSPLGAKLIKNQIAILKTLQHKNILQLIQTVQKNGKIYVVTNFCEGRDLQNYLQKNKKVQQKVAIKYFKHIVKGCMYLKQLNIIHRDLKLSNIFLSNDIPIIADFGFAVYENDKRLKNINAGSPLYMPFQSLSQKKFSQKSDVFALGVILFQMLTGKTPWTAKSETQLMQKLKFQPKISTQFNPEVKQLILKCLSFKSQDRPSVDQIFKNLEKIQNKPDKVVLKQNNFVRLQNKENKQTCLTSRQTKNTKYSKQNKQNVKINIQIRQRSMTLNPNKNLEGYTIKKQPNIRQNSHDFLNGLDPSKFLFLPQSLIGKFKYILWQYKRILGINATQIDKIKENYEKDAFIIQINSCETQTQLCKTIEGFVRRLFRLAKNYKQYHGCLQNLQKLHNRVTKIII